MSAPIPVNLNPAESPYVFDGRVHIAHFTYACLAISCLCGLMSPVFIPGYFIVIGIILPPLLHGILMAAVWQRWVYVLQVGLGLMVVLYISALLSICVCLAEEVAQHKRGSWKLYLLHASALGGLWSNVLLATIYGMYKLIKVIKQDYTAFRNDDFN